MDVGDATGVECSGVGAFSGGCRCGQVPDGEDTGSVSGFDDGGDEFVGGSFLMEGDAGALGGQVDDGGDPVESA